MRRAYGIGGFFIKCADREAMKTWYKEVLGLSGDYGVVFQWHDPENQFKIGHTVFSFFKSDTHYFLPSSADFMINYRVKNLEKMIDGLSEDGVMVMPEREEYEFGRFGWAVDPFGNKLEFWEPIDEVYQQYYQPLPYINGIGGIFFMHDRPGTVQKWYSENLKMESDEYGIRFDWLKNVGSKPVWLEWAVYDKKHGHKVFRPSEKPYMINFVVSDWNGLMANLEKHNVPLLAEPELYTEGTFTWILDPEGNKIELWAP